VETEDHYYRVRGSYCASDRREGGGMTETILRRWVTDYDEYRLVLDIWGCNRTERRALPHGKSRPRKWNVTTLTESQLDRAADAGKLRRDMSLPKKS
jgi:hypothetical protein